MYVQSGLGAYRTRRGMGDTVVTDPATGVSRVVTSSPITTDTVTSSGANVYTDSSGNITVGSGSSVTDWLNQNSTMVMVGAAALVGLLLFAKAGR